MGGNRSLIFDWVQQQRLPVEAIPEALRIAGVTPSRRDWQRFLESLALWMGAIFLAASVIFFFAYNWHDFARFAKFGLIEALLVAALSVCWYLNLDRVSGKAALLVATLLVGALLALVGQIYQTGADPWELFAVWALVVFPWVAVARFGALWLFCMGLLNVAVTLYYQTFGGLFGLLFSTERLIWVLFALNTLALCAWEFAAHRGIAWLQERWSVRVLAVASGGLITVLAVWAIVDFQSVGVGAVLGYAVWMMCAYAVYRYSLRDHFMLAGGVLSAIVVVTAFLSKHLLSHSNAGSFLFIGLVIIGLSAVGGMWLKSVAAERQE